MSKKRHKKPAPAPGSGPYLLPGDAVRIGGYHPIPPLDTSRAYDGLIRCADADADGRPGGLMAYWLPPGVSATDIRIRDRTAPPEGD
jgi:hypothetical protein